MNLLRATVELTHRNTRRYGGYLVHMGIVLMFIGFTGHAFNQSDVKELNVGDSMHVGRYDLKMTDLTQGENENYAWHRATMAVFRERRANRHAGAREALLQSQPAGHFRSRHAACARTKICTSTSAACRDDNQRAVIQAMCSRWSRGSGSAAWC